MMEIYKNIPVVSFNNLDGWIKWLNKNHSTIESGVWMKIIKKGSTKQGLNYAQTREGALRYGWIDSLPNKLDEDYYLLKVTPRRPKSVWSKINVALVDDLIAEDKMHESGLKEVEQAKLDGRWYKAY